MIYHILPFSPQPPNLLSDLRDGPALLRGNSPVFDLRLRWTFLSSHQRSGEGKAGPHPSPQPLSSLGRGRRRRWERPKDLAASSIPKGNLPDSQAGHYWPRHLDLSHKCLGETAQGFLYWCSGAEQILWPIFVFQSLLPGDWRGFWEGLGPQIKVEQRFSPQGKRESDRRGI